MDGDNCCTEGPREDPPIPRALRDREEPVSSDYRNEANIQPVENGFIVRVGCKTFVSKDWAEVATALGEYWEDPAKAEKKFSRRR
jgi:hypothetical protein